MSAWVFSDLLVGVSLWARWILVHNPTVGVQLGETHPDPSPMLTLSPRSEKMMRKLQNPIQIQEHEQS